MQNRMLTLGTKPLRAMSAAKGSPAREAVRTSTRRVRCGRLQSYSSHATSTPHARAQASTKSSVSGRSMPVFANTTATSLGSRPP